MILPNKISYLSNIIQLSRANQIVIPMIICHQIEDNKSLFCLLSVILFQGYNKYQRMIEVSLSDIDFYQRKIKAMQEDNIALHQEVMRLRTRLRTAQDFEIKYNLILSSNQKQMAKAKAQLEKQQETKRHQFLMSMLKENDQMWEDKLKSFGQKLQKDNNDEIQSLQKSLNQKIEQLESLKTKSEQIQLLEFKMNKTDKQNRILKEEIEEMRIFYQKQRNDEITQLRSNLNASYRERIQNQKRRYQQKISLLQNKLNELEVKDDNVNFKASDATNRELASLKALLQQKAKDYAKQLQSLSHQLSQKNQEIKKIFKDRLQNDERYRAQIEQKNKYASLLEDKLLEKQKKHEIQLLNLIQKTNALIEHEKQEQNQQIRKLNADNLRFHQLWNEKISDHQNHIEEMQNQFDDEKRKLAEQKNNLKRKITELNSRLKESEGQRGMGQTQMLLNSYRQIDAKEDHIGSYQNGVVYFQRLYKKCQLKLEQKSKIVSKLYKDINDIRTEADRQLSEFKQKMKKDKKENNERILALQNQLRDTHDKLRNKQKQQRKRQRDVSKEIIDLQQKNKALKQINDELVRDYNRVIEDKKGVEIDCRQQRQRSFASKSDLNIIKKQKWLQLQKQKNQLHIIYKEKQQQLKLDYQQKIDDLNNKYNRIKQDLEVTHKENQLLLRENEHYRQQLEMNKENSKMTEYNKKIASLNLEIALTQNIYQSLKKAKSRVHPSESPQATFEVQEFDQNEESLHMTFHPSSTRK